MGHMWLVHWTKGALPDLSGVDTTEAKYGESGLQKIIQAEKIIELSETISIFHPNHKHNVEGKRINSGAQCRTKR